FGVDCTNGAAGVVIEPLIKALNLKAHVMFAEPDGQFSNHAPDPTEEENLSAIREFLNQNQDYSLAFAFDGDADRMVALSKTHVFCGDELCYLFAKNIPNPRILG
ncbi:phosphomannomutase/phosphoglucomutase, partial [Campylobacter jejuni]